MKSRTSQLTGGSFFVAKPGSVSRLDHRAGVVMKNIKLLGGISAVLLVLAGLHSAEVLASEKKFVLAIHGGGGGPPQSEVSEAKQQEYKVALQAALEAGYAVLSSGGDSVTAVEAAVRSMEDDPIFNAGKGSSYNRSGFIQMDATIMDGRTLDAGAVGVVQQVKNPVTLARRIMDSSPHVLLADEGALEFAKSQGLEIKPPHYFFTEARWDSLMRRLEQGTQYGKRPGEQTTSVQQSLDFGAFGTVGAVAMDQFGNLAAATSSGGREGKLPGRVGDSAVPGTGTYANNSTVAITTTGLGEYVIRVVSAKTISDLIEYKGMDLETAVSTVMGQISELGGTVGIVALDAKGNVTMPYGGHGMKRGYVREDGVFAVRIFEKE